MQNRFPSCWKLTKIVPLHKKGCVLSKQNYRPVAILSPLSKVLEKAIFEQIYDYFHRNKLFHPALHGYRVNRSTTTALLSMYEKWVCAASEGRLTGVVLVDLSAAFDLVTPDLLIQKLRISGLDEDFLVWVQSYLTNRYQTVWIDHVFSDFLETNIGVPQGSNLGPLLFLIFFNDLPLTVNNEIECYADDSTLSASSDLVANVEDKLTSDCGFLSKWMLENRFKLNPEKTHLLVIGTTNLLRKMPSDLRVFMDGVQLTKSLCKSELLLGVKIQQNLKWSEHISYLESKLKVRMAGLEKLKYVMSKSNRKMIVEGMFKSVLLYGLPLFGGCSKQELKCLQVQQNRAARLVLRAPPRTSTTLMLEKLSWLSVNQLIALQTLLMVYRIRKSKEPENLSEYFSQESRQGRIMMENIKQDFYRQSFVYRGSSLWNRLPCKIRCANTCSLFKKQVREWIQLNIEAIP